MSEKTPAVYAAICAVTAEMAHVGIAKGRKNAQQGYAFRGIDDVYAALSSVLAKEKLAIIPYVEERTVVENQSKNGGTLFYVTVAARFDLVSAVDGSKHSARCYGEAMDSADKATNKAMSAAYKYMALQTFCIPTEGDNDADATTPEPAPTHVGKAKLASEFATIVKTLQAFKDQIGKAAYYEVLGAQGVEHANEFKDYAQARDCWRALKARADQMGKKETA
ncbi:Essential recombination function protein [uncultured Caudovirales phage]|uniref:Essential recombination function protein n=1 Tax=uncultured Caudovirales phage TaxID=2100421 RepID=A0A6J5QQB8_9CAUD|nr:Essential recombination function protein [uncultured Caudovirales phage]